MLDFVCQELCKAKATVVWVPRTAQIANALTKVCWPGKELA
jgi:hypothetical protein